LRETKYGYKSGGQKMAHFYGTLQGHRGEATRCGSPNSGINAHLRSWKNDIYVRLEQDENGEDRLIVNLPEELNVKINGTNIWQQSKVEKEI
jgi:hypothetical protein